jgi:hypothetical protein
MNQVRCCNDYGSAGVCERLAWYIGTAYNPIAGVRLLFKGMEVSTMSRVKQTSTKKRVMKSAPVLGAAGLTFSMIGGASAAAVPTADVAQSPTVGLGHQVTLGEEEIADVSLATFYVFDKENTASAKSGVQVAWRGCGGCRGCRGCAGCRACRGCAGCRACGGGCCASWGACRFC